MNDIDTTTAINQHDMQQPVRRLKGLLALLPESGILYRRSHRERGSDAADHGMNLDQQSLLDSTKITSRKQQRRRIKRYKNLILGERSSSDLPIDVESGNCIIVDTNAPEQNATMTSCSIQLTDLIHDNDTAILFLFDPYQPYSLQLLQKLLAVGRLSRCESQPSRSETGIPVPSPTTVVEYNDINTQHHPSSMHCLVVTPCIDAILIARILENSGAVLLPWMSESNHWKIAMGGGANCHVCPSILAIIECSKGRNVFPTTANHHEELALDWNTSIHVYNSWFHHRTSALTTVQRIQMYALYPTSALCKIQ